MNKSKILVVSITVKSIFWHRRDLRFEDNKGLFFALSDCREVLPIFIFDKNILEHLNKNDQRIIFIHQSIQKLQKEYRKLNCQLGVFYGNPEEIIPKLVESYSIDAVYTNRDYEPYAQSRDRRIKALLDSKGILFKGYKDHVIFEKNEIIKDDGKPYTVFTPYSKKWKNNLNVSTDLKSFNTRSLAHKLFKENSIGNIDNFPLKSMGFENKQFHKFPSSDLDENLILNYAAKRNNPSLNGTSKLSVHLRFGTISIRQLALKTMKKSESYLNELIWRDFYQMIIFHFPHSAKNSFKAKYDFIAWENDENNFKLWCEGKTGYPLVDAGMRELNSTGFMHNRVRMVVASFLTKHLLIDWRWGEAYFAEKLLDYELASNVGGWQWASGSGCDAAPYFRVFNPKTQQEKFDKECEYIRKWVEEFDSPNYPNPIIEHSFARIRAIERYKKSLNS